MPSLVLLDFLIAGIGVFARDSQAGMVQSNRLEILSKNVFTLWGLPSPFACYICIK